MAYQQRRYMDFCRSAGAAGALEMARSFGLSIDRHLTRMLDAKMLEDADLVLVMEKGHQESIQFEFPFARKKIHLLSQVVEGFSYDIPDPV